MPPHRVDGDPSAAAFEVFFDPASLPPAAARDGEACLVDHRTEILDGLQRAFDL